MGAAMKRFFLAVMNLVLGLAVLGFVGLTALFGVGFVLIAISAGSPLKADCKDYLQNHHHAAWLVLTDCQVDFMQLVVETPDKTDTPSDYYAPIVSSVGEDPGNQKIRLMLKLEGDDRRLAELLVSPEPPDDEFRSLVEQRTGPRNIEGMTDSGLSDYDESGRMAGGLDLELADDWMFFEEGPPMPMWQALLFLLPAAGLLTWVVLAFLTGRREGSGKRGKFFLSPSPWHRPAPPWST